MFASSAPQLQNLIVRLGRQPCRVSKNDRYEQWYGEYGDGGDMGW